MSFGLFMVTHMNWVSMKDAKQSTEPAYVDYPITSGYALVQSTIVDAMTDKIYDNKLVKIGFYKTINGVDFAPLNNYTDSNGLHIEIPLVTQGIFYVVPFLQNNTDLFIAPVQTLYNNKQMQDFAFNSIGNNETKNWAFKVNGNYFKRNCINYICEVSEVPNFIINVYSYAKPVLHSGNNITQIENIGTSIMEQEEYPTKFYFTVDSGKCTMVPVTGYQLTLSPREETWWIVGKSNVSFGNMASIPLSKMALWADDNDLKYRYNFNPTISNAFASTKEEKQKDAMMAYYLPSKCNSKTIVPTLHNAMVLAMPEDKVINATETLFYLMPNGTEGSTSSSVLLCSDSCSGDSKDLYIKQLQSKIRELESLLPKVSEEIKK